MQSLTTEAKKRRASAQIERSRLRPSDDVVQARDDYNKFIEYCFSDEDGVAYKQAQHHREWQALFDQERVALLGHAEGGKSQQVALRLVWELGRNPELRCFIVSAQQENAKKTVALIKNAIDENTRVQEVFPDLKRGSVWGSSKLLVQRRRASATKDYSVQALGFKTRFHGIRADLFVVDDINDDQNSLTPEARAKVVKWFDSRIQTRLTKRGRVFVIGNAWHKEDLIHELAKRPGFTFKRYSVLADDQLKSRWPEQWPLSRILKVRKGMTPLQFARAYLCLPIDDEASRFESAWFQEAKRRGIGFVYSPERTPVDAHGAPLLVFSGVDPSSGRTGRKRKTNTTAIVTLGYSAIDHEFYLLDVRVGVWTSPQIITHMQALDRRYKGLFVVEDNGQQQLFIDSRELDDMRVTSLTTDAGKWDAVTGVEGLAIDFNAHRFVLPCSGARNSEGDLMSVDAVEVMLQNLMHFTPLEHTPDDVMALWIAWKAARRFSREYFAFVPRSTRR